jgi:hypothetical protein
MKVLFPQMDSYTKNYRGLRFIDNSRRLASPQADIDSLNGEGRDSSETQ